MVKTMEEITDSEKRFCVRYNDWSGLDTKFYKPKFPNEFERRRYHFCVNYVELLARKRLPPSVAETKEFQKFDFQKEFRKFGFQKEFQKFDFQRFSKGLKLKAMPKGYHSLSHGEKKKTVKKLVDELVDELAAAMNDGPIQGFDMEADDSGTLQVGARSACQFDKTVKEDVGMQVNNLGQIQVDEVQAEALNPDIGNTVSIDACLQDVAWNQCGNPQGQPPSRPHVPLEEIVFYFNDLMHRASRFPGVLPEFHWSEEAFWPFLHQLEMLEGALRDRSGFNYRSREEEFYAPLTDFSAYEDVTSLPSNERLADEIWTYIDISPGRPEAPGTISNVFTG